MNRTYDSLIIVDIKKHTRNFNKLKMQNCKNKNRFIFPFIICKQFL